VTSSPMKTRPCASAWSCGSRSEEP
jgi:hypothetical protein